MSSGERARPGQRPHTLADHMLGELAGHVHDEDADHDHDHDAMDGLLQPGESGHVTLTSIGIDIGSSGTQIAFARLSQERLLARRETLYESPVTLTPFAADDTIDEAQLGSILDAAFAAARIHPDDVDCGVVILTGLAREQRNAEIIARRLAADCGDIVSASAGHHMEARLAAFGSGAAGRSAATRRRFLNIDIGGATTKLAICDSGRIEATAALQIGGRLAAFDADHRIVRLAPAAKAQADRCGLDWHLGGLAPAEEVTRLARQMADDLLAVVGSRTMPAHLRSLFVTPPIQSIENIDGIIVSGGVGEYVYARETRSFGDLGRDLGQAISARIDAGALPAPLMPATHCIRATVLGASSYSVQLSGRTSWISNAGALLPQRNLQVLAPAIDLGGDIDADAVATAVRDHLAAFDIADANPAVAFALRWRGPPEYQRLRRLADGLVAGAAERIRADLPLCLVVEGDIAHSLGAVLSEELAVPVDLLVLDGITLADFDFVDLGRIRLPSQTVPVTIKTLAFRPEPVQKSARRHR